jgi:Adenylosuccinate synthase
MTRPKDKGGGSPLAHVVVGLAYGDEGKGSWVDYLVRRHGARYVVRFNGGAQAAHHVVAPDGRMHCFRQFGSGMFVPEVKTVLSRYMLADPEYILKEAEELKGKGVKEPLSRMLVSARTPVITPFSRLLNQMQEVARGYNRHGSCGYGIGITQADLETPGQLTLRMEDLDSPGLEEKLYHLWFIRTDDARRYLGEATAGLFRTLSDIDINHYARLFREFRARVQVVDDGDILDIIAANDTVFEGAQGLMLDQRYGTFPHCTRSNCTFENANVLLAQAGFPGRVRRVGVLRAYGTRHGDGPFPSEDSRLAVSPCHNGSNLWQGQFRVGWFDAVAARYALAVTSGVDCLAVTNVDRLAGLGTLKIATTYEHTGDRAGLFAPSGDLIKPAVWDLEALRVRTQAMALIKPTFKEVSGFRAGDDQGIRRYLSQLSEEVGHAIHAYSASSGPDKIAID